MAQAMRSTTTWCGSGITAARLPYNVCRAVTTEGAAPTAAPAPDTAAARRPQPRSSLRPQLVKGPARFVGQEPLLPTAGLDDRLLQGGHKARGVQARSSPLQVSLF